MTKVIEWIVLVIASASCVGCAPVVTSSMGRTVVVSAGFIDSGVEKALSAVQIECQKRGLSA